jgi:hypothetical protein
MPYNDGISATHSFSLTDFHEFEKCSFAFFVKHHLGKKYELADSEGSLQLALGSLLDGAIKKFHESKAYGCPPEYIYNLIKASCSEIQEKIKKQKGPSFYSSIEKFLDDGLCEKAAKIFTDYYVGRERKINRSLGSVGFCEWIIEVEDNKYKLWGGPDAFEEGEDGVPEVVDYKSREDIEIGKRGMDMDLMPKIYILLSLPFLQKNNFKRARFVVRFWQDPLEAGFYEEFDLEKFKELEELFKYKIEKILGVTEFSFCEKPYCKACKAQKRNEFVMGLQKMGLMVTNIADLPELALQGVV